MSRSLAVLAGCVGLALAAAAGCDRNLEAFDPNEQPQEPDLSRIFPAGAERARSVAGMPPPPGAEAASGGRGAPPVTSSAAPIRGTITLADGFSGRARSGAVLFLIARASESGPPLAVKRISAPSFPLEFSLGPDDRMIQSRPFVGPLRISARLDADGNASSRTPGDLEGVAPGSYDPGAEGVSLVIDEVL